MQVQKRHPKSLSECLGVDRDLFFKLTDIQIFIKTFFLEKNQKI